MTGQPDRRNHQRQVRAELAERRHAGLQRRHAAKLNRLAGDLPGALRVLRQRVRDLVRQALADPAAADTLAGQISSEFTVLITRGPQPYIDHVTATTATNTEITTTEKETNQ